MTQTSARRAPSLPTTMLARATVLACAVTMVLAAGAARAESPEQARTALMELFQATNGGYWARKDGWGGPKSHCSWHGVKCSVLDNNVTAMCAAAARAGEGGAQLTRARSELPHNNLVGKIPESIGSLTSLKTLDLSFNVLHGEIPRSIVRLQVLAILSLQHNLLTGRLPSSTDSRYPWPMRTLRKVCVRRATAAAAFWLTRTAAATCRTTSSSRAAPTSTTGSARQTCRRPRRASACRRWT